jgi:anti-sigma regulatory factor (Ser/Thr protein kinase)
VNGTTRATTGEAASRPVPGFRHEALFYSGLDEFATAVASFVRDGLAAEEAVLVAVIDAPAERLRDELGSDARAVRFLDMARVGRNPGRIIPAWQAWVDEQRAADRAFRGVGEPIWAGRSPAEIVECRQHEALLNTVFGAGPGWWLLCPFDLAGLGPVAVDYAEPTHPTLLDGARRRVSGRYPAADLSSAGMLADPLPEPAGPIEFETRYAFEDLARIRTAVRERGRAVGLGHAESADLVLAVNELVTNSVIHGGGVGWLRVWLESGALVAEVRDNGRITDPLIGRRKPTADGSGGAGVWMVHRLCDLVQIRSSLEKGTTVRIRVAIP